MTFRQGRSCGPYRRLGPLRGLPREPIASIKAAQVEFAPSCSHLFPVIPLPHLLADLQQRRAKTGHGRYDAFAENVDTTGAVCKQIILGFMYRVCVRVCVLPGESATCDSVLRESYFHYFLALFFLTLARMHARSLRSTGHVEIP